MPGLEGYFEGHRCLITGGARGIGRNIAARLAEQGATVVIADIDQEGGEETARALGHSGGEVFFHAVDLSDPQAAEAMIDSLVNRLGSLDILVNNARGGRRTAPLDEAEENWQTAFDISLKAPLFASQAFIRQPPLKDRTRAIVNISSVVAQTICGESAVYHLTKAALENMTRYLAVHGGPRGVRVNAVRPGLIVQDEHRPRYDRADNVRYRRTAEFCHPLQTVGRADDIAHAVLFLSSSQAGFITGQVLSVDGGLTIQDPYDLLKRYEAEHAARS